MRNRKGLVFVIALLGFASLMVAMSFSSVTVQAKAKMRIVDTTNGLLALMPGDGGAASVDGNNLVIDLTEGSQHYGLQPGSSYTWDSLFKLKNNSNQTIQVKADSLGDLSSIGSFSTTVFINGKPNGSILDNVTLKPGETGVVKLTVNVNENAPKLDGDSNITISAHSVSAH